jgi:hypothetical protein
MPKRRIALWIVLVITIASRTSAQWLKQPTPGLARTPDGHVDLSARPPRTKDGTPDLSGMWGWQPGRYLFTLGIDLTPSDIRDWAVGVANARRERLGKDDPNFRCLPQGPRMNLYAPIPVKIVQTPTLVLVLSEELTYRQIFLDGRALPKDPEPSFMGYSVGHWEGDTLVVETTGFKDSTWLDFSGLPHTEALRITKRLHRTSVGHLDITETIDNPGVFTKPFTVRFGAQFVPDTELLEFVCNENERSGQHIVGTASELMKEVVQRAVKVAPATLEKYAGTYDFRFPENPTTPTLFPIRLESDTLFFDSLPLVPLSETTFAGPVGTIEFVTNAEGVVTHLLVQLVEGDLQAARVP